MVSGCGGGGGGLVIPDGKGGGGAGRGDLRVIGRAAKIIFMN